MRIVTWLELDTDPGNVTSAHVPDRFVPTCVSRPAPALTKMFTSAAVVLFFHATRTMPLFTARESRPGFMSVISLVPIEKVGLSPVTLVDAPFESRQVTVTW